MSRGWGGIGVLPLAAAMALSGCGFTTKVATGTGATPRGPSGPLRIYASVPQKTLDALAKAFEQRDPQVQVSIYRNGTGPVAARIAAEERAGGIQADVVWTADPTPLQALSRQGKLLSWTPQGLQAIPTAYRSPDKTYFGTRVINVILAYHPGSGVPKPKNFADLLKPVYRNRIGIANPAYAGSTFAELGTFVQDPGLTWRYFEGLKANGAVQETGNQQVADGVASGQFAVGITLDYMVRPMEKKGSPIEAIWPQSGAVSVYSPIGIIQGSPHAAAAKAFVNFVLSRPGQTILLKKSFMPVRTDLPGAPAAGTTVTPPWAYLLQNKKALLARYAQIFG